MDILGKKYERVWLKFQELEDLTGEQLNLFKKYASLILEWNEKFNLTAISNLPEVITKHFRDSLILRKYLELNDFSTIADVGAGAGLPGIPLKILFPNLGLVLIEVNRKKLKFLKEVINSLNMKNVELCEMDWRTFLRKTEGNIDLFVARASLDPIELCRMFKPASSYREAKLVYWASESFEVSPRIEKFVLDVKNYKLGYRRSKLMFLGRRRGKPRVFKAEMKASLVGKI